MVSPLDIGAGLTAAGVAGSLFAKPATPNVDVNGLLSTINQSAARQRQIASALPGQLAPVGTALQTGTDAAVGKAQTAEQASATKFLADTGKTIDSQGQQLSDTLKQRVLGALPEEQEALRESLAATGGLKRGATSAAMEGLAGETAGKLEEGNQAIVAQSNADRQNNLKTVMGMDNNMIMQKLGIDKDTLTALYNSGRQDLITEANSLLGIEQNTDNATLGVQEFGLSNDLSTQANAAAQQQALYNALLSAGGNIVGQASRPVPKPVS